MSPYEILQPGGSVEHYNKETGAAWLQRLLENWQGRLAEPGAYRLLAIPPVHCDYPEHHAQPYVWRYRQRHRTRSEEHTSALQSLMRISYAVLSLKKKSKIRAAR